MSFWGRLFGRGGNGRLTSGQMFSESRPRPTSPWTSAPSYTHGNPVGVDVHCSKCAREYHLGVDAAVVSDDGVGEDFAVVGGPYTGGGPNSPDLVAPLAPGRTPTQDTLKEVARLQSVRALSKPRYWQCHICKVIYPYPWTGR